METTQFSGETPLEAIINNNSLDIEEEDFFRNFLIVNNIDVASLKSLEKAYDKWELLRGHSDTV